jgi:hypothetical protein
MTLTRARSVLLTVLVVASAVLASPGVGTVAAVHDCSNKDAAVYGFSFGFVNEDKCTNNHVDQAVTEVREAETAQNKVDIYLALNAQTEQSRTFEATMSNYMQDTESPAWMKAEAAVAEAYENGSTKAEAKSKARSAIEDYYAKKQVNIIRNWETNSMAVLAMQRRSYQEGFSTQYGSKDQGDNIHVEGDYDKLNNGRFSTGFDPANRTTTLANGTDVTYNTTEVACSSSGAMSVSESGADYGCDDVWIESPSSDYNKTVVFDLSYASERWSETETLSQNLKSDVNAYVDSVYPALEDGSLNSSEIISRQTRMFEYGTEAQNGSSGSYYDVLGATAAMGLAAPQLNETGQMTLTDSSGNTSEGMLFARNPPNGKWEVGETYDPANISGPVQFATKGGSLRQLEQPFTVESATDKSGDSRSTVQTKDYSYRTADASQTAEKYSDLLRMTENLQQESESVDSEGSGGGGGSSGGSVPGWLTQSFFGIPVWVIVALFLLVVVLFGGGS